MQYDDSRLRGVPNWQRDSAIKDFKRADEELRRKREVEE